MELEESKKKFTELMKSFQCDQRKQEFLQWISNNYDRNMNGFNGEILKAKKNEKAEILLACIKSELRKKVPSNAIMNSEVILYPTVGEDSHLHEKNCTHVDAFLYDENDVDELIDQGKLATHHCLDCHSTNIESITYITHSTSKERLQYIFQRGLPSLKGKVVLDVGSRLGVVLYAAYVYTEATEIIGVEINKELCKLQNDLVNRFKLVDRIRIIEGNILERGDIVEKANVITLHNVFEWFMSIEEQVTIWKFLHKNIKVGTIIVAATAIEDTLTLLNTSIDCKQWVREFHSEDVICIEENQLKIYEVIKK